MISCTTGKHIIQRRTTSGLSGTAFYKQAAAYNWAQRDSLAVQQVLQGNMPAFLKKFVPVTTQIIADDGQVVKAVFYVSPDYLSIGNNEDWARVPLTPMAAQKVADSFDCFLPTRKMVDLIYKAAEVKLEPLPMFALRDSTPTMYHHHLIIEGQRKGKRGLIGGIKKDVVISGKISRNAKPNRVAIYGWHMPGGKVIQPLYTGHVNWYVDYSHGIRLIYNKVKVNGKWTDYREVLKSQILQKLLCDEEVCDYYSYEY